MDSLTLKTFAKTLGLDAVGIAPAAVPLPPPAYQQSPLCPLAAGTGAERYEPVRLLPSCQSVVVVLFPYYLGDHEPANLSLYCRPADYHLIARSYLDKLAAFMTAAEPAAACHCIIDTSPLDERWLAFQSGLGFFGDNHCFIHATYGSYCFIGAILTSLSLIPDTPRPDAGCCHCGRCAVSCPGRCFTPDGRYEYGRCKSFLTQKKGSLTLPEIAILKKTPLIFGCDECQRVCPHNQGVPPTPLPEFHQDRLLTLDAAMLSSLSNRQFQQAYGTRAFAWRGKKILLRNLDYLSTPLEAGDEGDDGHGNVQEEEDNAARH